MEQQRTPCAPTEHDGAGDCGSVILFDAFVAQRS